MAKSRQSRRDFLKSTAAIAAAAVASPQALGKGKTHARAKTPRKPPIAHGDGPEPAFHGPGVVGCTPGRPFSFKVPLTGQQSVTLHAADLPAGLKMSPDGLVSGQAPAAGAHRFVVTAANSKGQARREIKIIAGEHKLVQTPPMGWNCDYSISYAITADDVKRAADAMVKRGLAAKGYRYVIVDDAWEGKRTASGQITGNKKFPNMKELGDYIHARGLKFGLYSSPGPETCGGYPGSYGHVQQDVDTYAQWGVDYVKYDWCTYGNVATGKGVDYFRRPYTELRTALDKIDRDMVFEISAAGMGNVATWAGKAPVWANTWRIGRDMVPPNKFWEVLTYLGFGIDGPLSRFAGPGHWNTPGAVVFMPYKPPLTPWEKVSYITLWCMLAAPLIVSAMLDKLDSFELDVLLNSEVIGVDQDPLGKQAIRVAHHPHKHTQVWARPLFDGTYAVALFNLAEREQTVHAHWSDLAAVGPNDQAPFSGTQPVRDLWQRQHLGGYDGFSASIPRHGVRLLKVGHTTA